MRERLNAFMARANAAYYAGRDPFRDFTTSPEISQVFGEVLGGWACVVWEAMGRPHPVLLVECGPGRGTLMADALRVIARVPDFAAALRVHFVETSPRLRAEQAQRVPGAVWHDRVEDVPDGPMILLANEFLDALPIRQFVWDGTWAERFVQDGMFVQAPAEPPLPLAGEGWGEGGVTTTDLCVPCATLTPALSRQRERGQIWEHCGPAHDIVALVSRRIMTRGGAALFVDYGPAHSGPGDTLQALRNGAPAPVLTDPGTADLTAHVDFAALASTARNNGAAVHGPIQQGKFLATLGLFQRTGRLAQTQPAPRAAALVQAAQRLAEPDRMGSLFKAMAICHPSLPTPPGFDP